jgi:hypothetical protein
MSESECEIERERVTDRERQIEMSESVCKIERERE